MRNDVNRNLGSIILGVYVYGISDFNLFVNDMVNKNFRFLNLSLDKTEIV